jgi:hypothetical protein
MTDVVACVDIESCERALNSIRNLRSILVSPFSRILFGFGCKSRVSEFLLHVTLAAGFLAKSLIQWELMGSDVAYDG